MPSSRLAAIQKSTIVRSFALLERVAPAAGARWAEALWFTVPNGHPRPPRPAGAPGPPVPGRGPRPHGRRRGLGRTAAGGAPDRADPPAVYLVHGWGGWRWQLDAFVAPLVEAGFRVVAFDAPSHGDSDPGPEGRAAAPSSSSPTPWPRWWPPTARPTRWSPTPSGPRRPPTPCAPAWPAGRLVFVAPMADPLPYTRTFAGRLGFGERVRTRLVARIERRVGTSDVGL